MTAPKQEQLEQRLGNIIQSRTKPPLPWLQILIFVAALGVVGWFGYQHWLYRLPQERDLVLSGGKVLHARIDGRDNSLLKITLIEGGQTRYLPIASLSINDQNFIRNLEAGLSLSFPLELALTDADGKEVPVRLESRDNNWVQVTYLADNSQNCLPIASLAEADRMVIQALPAPGLNFPLKYVFSDATGQKVSVSLEARNDDWVQITNLLNQSRMYLPIASLAQSDQALVRVMPVQAFDYPVSYTVIGPMQAGAHWEITGRDKNVVAFNILPDRSSRYFLISDLSSIDQSFINELPDHLNFNWPLDCTMSDKTGAPIKIYATGRIPDFVILGDPVEGTAEYRPIASFSEEDQKVFKLLKSSSPPRYPFDLTLIDQSKRVLQAKVLGRSSTAVKIQLTNGTLITYPLDELSQQNQQFLRSLPDNLSAPVESQQLKNLRAEVAELEKQNLLLESDISNPNIPQGQREIDQANLDRNERQISSDNLKIRADTMPPASNGQR